MQNKDDIPAIVGFTRLAPQSRHEEKTHESWTWIILGDANGSRSPEIQKLLLPKNATSWAGQDAQNKPISLCPAQFFEFRPKILTRN